VLVEPPADGDDDTDMRLSILKAEKKPAPVGVGGRKEEGGEDQPDDGGALDQPAVEPPAGDAEQ
jgi:ATP-dependent Clp protease ATP-binding subunit ClpC